MTLDKGSKTYLRYCEMGLKLMRIYKNGELENREAFLDHDCDLILCISCWNKMVLLHEQEVREKLGIQSKRCSARKKI